MTRNISKELKREIIRLAKAGKMKKDIARELGVSTQTVGRHTPNIVSPYARTPIDEKQRQELIDRVAKGHVFSKVARELGLNPDSASTYRIVQHLEDIEIPKATLLKIKNELANGKVKGDIALEFGLPISAIRKISGTDQRSITKLSPEDIAQIIKLTEQGYTQEIVAKKFKISSSSVYRIFKKAIAEGRAKPRPVHRTRHDDKECTWITRIDPNLEAWRQLIVKWLTGEIYNRHTTITAISHFVERYLIEKMGSASPADLLARRDEVIPDFYEAVCKEKTSAGVALNNCIYRFLEWVLLTEEFADFSSGEPISNTVMFRNPIRELNFRRGHIEKAKNNTESNKILMPYFMIHDLRRRIAQGPTYRDWKWVQSLLASRKQLDGNTVNADWYEVDYALIEKGKNDLNFVSRKRIVENKTVWEAWNPVRFTAILLNIQVTGRMGQIRMSDSGEADTYIYKNGKFVRNTGPLALGTPKKPCRQAILRQPRPEDGDIDVLLFYNTNKTSDIGKTGEDKGQACPWPKPSNPEDFADDPYHWLETLRDWQMNYNPIDRLTAWGELPAKRNLGSKSDEQNAEYLDTAFLFRTPDTPGHTAWPVTSGVLDGGWCALLAAYELILADEKVTHPDGTPYRLIDPETGRPESSPHAQRVSLITHMIIDGGMPPELMMKIAGHQRFIMTIYYCKPGFKHIQEAIAGAAVKLDANKHITLMRDLAGIKAEQMRDHVVFNAEDWATVLPVNPADRNPLGWLDMHDGICLAGGNTGPLDGNNKVPGCHNGGSVTRKGDLNEPVSGGVRNCTRCRWKCAGKRHALGLAATLNNRQYHLHKAGERAIAAERQRNDLLKLKKKAEDEGRPFENMKEIRQAERLYMDAMQRLVELGEDVAAVHRIIERIHALPDHTDGTMAVALQGDEAALQVVLEDTDSELLVLSQICEDVEFFPELNPGTAVFEFGQLLDQAFEREGYALVFARMSEQEKLTAANAFMRALEQYADPANKLVARRKVVEILDRHDSIEQLLGVSFKELISVSSQPEKKIVSLRLIKNDGGGDDQQRSAS